MILDDNDEVFEIHPFLNKTIRTYLIKYQNLKSLGEFVRHIQATSKVQAETIFRAIDNYENEDEIKIISIKVKEY